MLDHSRHRGESATKTVKFFVAHKVNCVICNNHTIIDWMLLNFTPVIQQNCHHPGRKFEKSFCAVDRLSCQLELSKSETSQLHQPRLWFITGGYLVKRWFIPAAARARGQSNDLNREILASNLFNCHKEVINTPPVPSISRCIHIVYRHKNVWEYQWSNFIYNCMSTFLHYVHCKDALLDCSAPGGERCESLTWVDEIQKRSCFWYRKLYACNLLTRGLNVVLRYLTSSDICVAKIVWASNVPESSRCWQHHTN